MIAPLRDRGNVTYQHDTRSSVTNLLALNVIFHLYFETRRPAQPDVAVGGGPGRP